MSSIPRDPRASLCRKSLVADPAVWFGIHVEGVDIINRKPMAIWLHNDRELVTFRMNSLADMLEELDMYGTRLVV
jgi:hypothetical protein